MRKKRLLWFLTISVSVVMFCACSGAGGRAPLTGRQPATEPLTQGIDADGWEVAVSVRPPAVGPIAVSVEDLRRAAEDESAWIRLTLNLENRGKLPARFDDTRRATFLKTSGEPVLLAADVGCGFGGAGKGSVVPYCQFYLAPFTVPPDSSVSRGITLYKELPGMSDLGEGTYVFGREIRFRVRERLYAETVRVIYQIRHPADTG